jgi:putative metallohydrolase (TIGR04338 family)
MMPRPRDSQRSKVYAAEQAAFPNIHNGHLTVPEMQALIDKWCSSAVLQRKYPRAAMVPLVTDGRGRRKGGYRSSTCELRMPRFARTKPYLLHELAHHLTHHPARACHGWEYAECMLYLVRVFISRSASETLATTYRAHKVKHRAPRTRQMTVAQRQAARERMLAYHARTGAL